MKNRKKLLMIFRVAAFIGCCLLCGLFLMSFTEYDEFFGCIVWERVRIVDGETETEVELTENAPKLGCTYLLNYTLYDIPERAEMYFTQSTDEITLYLDGSEIYSYAAVDGGSVETGATVYLPPDCEGKTLTVRYRALSEDYRYIPVFCIKDTDQNTKLDYARANSSAIPAGVYGLASMVMSAMLLLNRRVDYRLIPLTLAFLVLTVKCIVLGQGSFFLNADFVSLVYSQIVLHLPLLLLLCHIFLNRKRTDKRVFLRVAIAATALVITVYLVSLGIGGNFAHELIVEFINIGDCYPLKSVFLITDMLLFICLVSAAYVMFTENAAAEAERKALAIKETAAREAYAALEENTRRSSEFRHEIKNHIMAMSALAHREEHDKLMKYIDKLDGEAVLLNSSSYTEHFLINAILQKYSAKASEAGVRFDGVAVVPPVIGISDEDICSLLMNMLDNALEAARIPPAEKPFISVKLRMTGGFFTVVCKNSCGAQLAENADGEYQTSKDDRSAHGFGIKQMRRVAEKYGSRLKCRAATAYSRLKPRSRPTDLQKIT